MAKKNNEIAAEVVAFAHTVTPLPIEREQTGAGNMVIWGDDNLYPNFLLELFKKVPLHQSISSSKSDYLIGDGLVNKATGKPLEIKISYKDTPEDFAAKISFDFVVFSWFAVGVLYNIFGDAVAVYHIPANHVRTNKSKTKFWVCDDWYYNSANVLSYEGFKPGKNKDLKPKVYIYTSYVPGANNVYPSIRYESAITNMVTEMLINDFGKTNLEEGFSAAHIISFFKGMPDSTAGQLFTDKVKKAYSGVKGAKYIIDFNTPPTAQSPASPVKVASVDTPDYTAKLENTKRTNETNILAAHQAPSRALFGIEQAAGLNGNDLENAYAIFKKVWVRSNRNAVESGLNILFKAIGFPEIEFKDGGAALPKNLSDTTKEKVYTIDELRAIDGLPPMADGSGVKVLQQGLILGGTPGEVSSSGEKVLIEILGIGGTQALQAVLADTTMTPEQKKNALMIIFGLTEANASILAGVVSGTVNVEKLSEQKPKGRILTDEDFEKVKDLGISRADFSVLDEAEFNAFSAESVRRVQIQFDDAADIEEYILNNDLSEKSVSEIRAAVLKDLGIKITTQELKDKLAKLKEAGVIGDTEKKKPLTRDVKVLYEYDVRKGFGEKIIPGSRGFCKKLIANDRYYTREDIQQMSAIFGYEVFKHCGGWFFNPKTQEAENQCRHYWKSVRVIKKQSNG